MSHHSPILVTGAAGFIGSHLCEALLARGDRVVGLDSFDPYYNRELKDRNLAAVKQAAPSERAFRFVQADIVDAVAMNDLFQSIKPAGVIHLAAKAGVRPSVADPVGYSRTNVVGTSVLLDAARSAGCQRFVMASSSSVYGNCKIAPFSETFDVSEPISPYAATKKACELIGHTHWHLTRMPTACLRFFTVFGPRQRPDLAIRLFLGLVGRGEQIPVYGSLEASRDYTYIDDIIRGVVASYDRIDQHGFRVWNLGSKHPVSLREMIETIGRVTGRAPKLNEQPSRPGDVERTFADLTRASAELDYAPTLAFEEGVRRQWAWMQREGLTS